MWDLGFAKEDFYCACFKNDNNNCTHIKWISGANADAKCAQDCYPGRELRTGNFEFKHSQHLRELSSDIIDSFKKKLSDRFHNKKVRMLILMISKLLQPSTAAGCHLFVNELIPFKGQLSNLHFSDKRLYWQLWDELWQVVCICIRTRQSQLMQKSWRLQDRGRNKAPKLYQRQKANILLFICNSHDGVKSKIIIFLCILELQVIIVDSWREELKSCTLLASEMTGNTYGSIFHAKPSTSKKWMMRS